MSTSQFDRAEPCTKCGRDVTVVVMERRGQRAGQRFAPPPTRAIVHTDQLGTLGGAADDACTREPL